MFLCRFTSALDDRFIAEGLSYLSKKSVFRKMCICAPKSVDLKGIRFLDIFEGGLVFMLDVFNPCLVVPTN